MKNLLPLHPLSTVPLLPTAIITGRGVLQALKSHKPYVPSTNIRHMDSTKVCMYDKENAEGGDQDKGWSSYRRHLFISACLGICLGGRRREMGG